MSKKIKSIQKKSLEDRIELLESLVNELYSVLQAEPAIRIDFLAVKLMAIRKVKP